MVSESSDDYEYDAYAGGFRGYGEQEGELAYLHVLQLTVLTNNVAGGVMVENAIYGQRAGTVVENSHYGTLNEQRQLTQGSSDVFEYVPVADQQQQQFEQGYFIDEVYSGAPVGSNAGSVWVRTCA